TQAVAVGKGLAAALPQRARTEAGKDATLERGAAERAGAPRRSEGANDDDVLVLASSDMSHYIPHEAAVARDKLAIDRLLALDAAGLYDVCEREDITMCGVLPATALLAYARERGATRAELVKYATSGEAFGAYDAVVGYAGVVIRE